MIYLKEKETKDIKLQISGFSYNFINYSYLTCRAFIESQEKDKIFTKGYFIDDVLSSIFYNQPLIYAFNDTTLQLNEAYYITKSIIYIITKKIFSVEDLIEKEIRNLSICIENKENIKEVFLIEKSLKSKKELKDFEELIDKCHPVDEYKLEVVFLLLQRIQGDMYNTTLQDAVYDYYSSLVIYEIIKDKEQDHQTLEYSLDIIENFIHKNVSTFRYLVKIIIHQLYEEKESDISTYETKNNFLRLDNYLKTKISLIQ